MKEFEVLKLYEMDEIDRSKMMHLAALLIKIAKRLLAEELEVAKRLSEKESA